MASGSVWVESMGVASGCGCKEVIDYLQNIMQSMFTYQQNYMHVALRGSIFLSR